jgi:hypothetical protein
MNPSPQRRHGDVPVWLRRLQAYEARPSGSPFWDPASDPAAASLPDGPGDYALLVEREEGEAMLFLGDRFRRMDPPKNGGTPMPWLEDSKPGDTNGDAPDPDSSDQLDASVAREVALWKAGRTLQVRRAAMAKAYVLLSERVHRTRARKDILDALAELADEVVNGFGTVLYVRGEAEDGTIRLIPRPGSRIESQGPSLPTLPTEAATTLTEPAVLLRETLEGGSEPELTGLLGVFEALEATSLVAAPLAGEGLLVVAERRERRRFDDEDCFFLRNVGRMAGAALRKAH